MTEPIRINSVSQPGQASRPASSTKSAAGGSFADALQAAQGIKFSNHAQKRLETRNINLSNDDLSRLQTAVNKAEKRGGKDSLVLMDDMAFIVNVREHLVVTALETQNRGEGVFTNIDSVVIADPSQDAALSE